MTSAIGRRSGSGGGRFRRRVASAGGSAQRQAGPRFGVKVWPPDWSRSAAAGWARGRRRGRRGGPRRGPWIRPGGSAGARGQEGRPGTGGRGRIGPFRRRHGGRSEGTGRSAFIASIRSATWKATPSRVARARSATVVARVRPKMVPRASGSQWGRPGPSGRGRRGRRSRGRRSRQRRSISGAAPTALRPSRNHCTAAPATKTLPSRAYCGGPSPRVAARVVIRPRVEGTTGRPCGPAGKRRCRRCTWPGRRPGTPGRRATPAGRRPLPRSGARREDSPDPRVCAEIADARARFRAIFRRGTSKKSQRSSAHWSVRRSISSVREALVTSVTCRWPPVRCQIKRLSTVPAASSPASAVAGAGDVVEQPGDLGGREIGVEHQPGRSAIQPRRSRCRSQKAAVRRSCQTRAGPIAWPVFRSQTTVVSR